MKTIRVPHKTKAVPSNFWALTLRTVGRRETPVGELYAGVSRSILDSRREVITAIRFPAHRAGEGSAYQRLEQRQGLSLPMLCAAVKVRLAAGKVERAVVVAAPLSPGPRQLTVAEEYLVGSVRKPLKKISPRPGAWPPSRSNFETAPSAAGAITASGCCRC